MSGSSTAFLHSRIANWNIIFGMRRLMPIAAFLLMLALPAWAQRGGGHAGGHGGGFAGHGGFSGGHIGGDHVSGGMHSSPGFTRSFSRGPAFSQRGFAQHNFSYRGSTHRPFLHDGFRGRRFRTYGFRNNCYGYFCRGYSYPWIYSGFYDPYWWWDSGSSDYQNFDEDYERDLAEANQMNAQSLQEQQMRRQEQQNADDQDAADQDRYAKSAPAAPRESATGGAPARHGAGFPRSAQAGNPELRHRRSDALDLRSPAHAKRFRSPISTLAATTKANDDRGLTFRVPAANEAQ